MDITYVYYTDFRSGRAHGNQILHTCNALARQGHNVTVVSAGDLQKFASKNSVNIEFSYIDHGLYDLRSKTDMYYSSADRAIYYIRCLKAAYNVDVIYTRDILFLKFLSKLPTDVFTPAPIAYEALNAYHQLSREDISAKEEYQYISNANILFAISDGIREDLNTIGIEVNTLLPDAAPTDLVPETSKAQLREKLDLDPEKTIFTYAGGFQQSKNELQLVIEGASELAKKEDILLLLIGGKDEEIRNLKRYSEDVGMPKNNIQFTGRIPHKKVFEYNKASDIGLVPLRSDKTEWTKYTSPLKLYEYLVCGLSVLASDVPAMEALKESIPELYLYEENNVASFVEAYETIGNSENTGFDPGKYSYESRANTIIETIKRSPLVKRD